MPESYNEKRAHLRRLCRQWAATQMVHEWSGHMANLDLPTPQGEHERLIGIMDDLWAQIRATDEESRHEYTTYGKRTYCERIINAL